MGKKRKADGLSNAPPKKTKVTPQDNSPGRSAPRTLVVDDGEEKSFPRGGHQTLTPLERRVIRERAKEDVLFSEAPVAGTSADDGDNQPLRKEHWKRKGNFEGEGDKRTSKRLDILNRKAIIPGTLLLGAVQEIQEFEVLVSLPFNMRGGVPLTNVSDPITQLVESEAHSVNEEDMDSSAGRDESEIPSLERLFHVGSLQPFYVTSVDSEKSRFGLSVNPSLINSHITTRDVKPGLVLPAWVKSLEDHGYIVDFGVEGKLGFLLKKNASEFIKTCNRGRTLCLGQVVQCLVLPGADARSVPVTINPSAVRSSLISADSLMAMHSLLPGLLVNAAVKEVASNELLMSFLGGFEGTVGLTHLPEGEYSTEHYNPRKKLKARLLWVNVSSKAIGLSLQKQIVAGEAFKLADVEIGDIFHDVRVAHIDRASSLFLELPNALRGYAPLRLVYDRRQESLGKQHQKDTRHSCRVVQFNLLDGLAIVSLQTSVLEKPFMKYADIKVGEIVEGTVERHGDFGMIISITDTIRGLCPRHHMSDTKLKQPKRKLKEGAKVKCRVLSVTPARRKLALSCKKSLVRSPHEPLVEYSLAKHGDIYTGVVSSVHHYGVIARFYGNVRGLIVKSELSSTQVIDDPSASFWPGQTVECKVLRCDPSTERLQLSLSLDSPVPMDVSEEKALCPGMTVQMEVAGIAWNGINLRYQESGELAFLPTMHLSDYPHLCPLLLNMHQNRLEAALKEGHPYVLEKLLVVCSKLNFRPPLVTLKRSLFASLMDQGFISQVPDLKIGHILAGYIKKSMPYGCFVEFPHNLSGLAPTKYLTDEFISDPIGLFQDCQSVLAKVIEVEESRGRFLLNLKASHLKLGHRLGEGEVGERLLEGFHGFVEERDTVLETWTNTTVPHQHNLAELVRMFHPGKCIKGIVTAVTGEEVELELAEGVAGRATTLTSQGIELQVGSEVQCCILDMDLVDPHLSVSLNPKLYEACPVAKEEDTATPKRRSKREKGKTVKQTTLQLSSSLNATVELMTPYYLICSCSTIAGLQLAYGLMDTGQVGVLPPSLKHLKPGQQVSTSVVSIASPFRGSSTCGLPVVMVTGTPATDRRLRRGSRVSAAAVSHDVKVGDIISVTVDNVRTTQLNVKYHLWSGRVHCCLASDHIEEGSIAFSDISPGDVVKARVIRFRERQISGKASKKGATIETLDLSTQPSLLDPSVGIEEDTLIRRTFTPGEEVIRFISAVSKKTLHVALSPVVEGIVPQLLASLDSEVLSNLSHHFAEGEAVKCTVVGSIEKRVYKLSLIGPVGTPSVGDITIGQIKQVIESSQAVVIAAHFGLGRVDVTDISDHYVDQPLKTVEKHLGSFVRCCVVGVDGDKVELSLRRSHTKHEEEGSDDEEEEKEDVLGLGSVGDTPTDSEVCSLEDVREGMVLRGYVKAITNIGTFVHLGRQIDGRVQITHLVDGFVKDFKKIHSIGALVKAKVLKVDPVNGKVDLSLRLSQVDPEAARKARKEAAAKEEAAFTKSKRVKRKQGTTSDGESMEASSESEAEEEEEEDRDMDTSSEEEDTTMATTRPSLHVVGGFQWDKGEKEEAPEGGSSSESDEEKEEPTSKKSRRQKKAAMKTEEAHIFQTEQALLDTRRAPENVEDLERLLLAHPNSSALWIQFMAFYLHTTEVDKARAVAQRALTTISFREEGEKLNVWVALMNLENLYGNQESLLKVFEQALQQNEPIEVFFRLTSVYETSNKLDLAEQLYQTMTKRFGSTLRVWTQFGEFLLKRGKLQAARNLLQRSLKSMASKQQHVDVICKFAQYEFKHGEPERGKTMFESLVGSYPKRVDLWSVYIDMVKKHGDHEKVSELFERATHLKVSTKKMKSIFKKYLQFERQHGSPAGVEAVKEKAKAYVESRTNE